MSTSKSNLDEQEEKRLFSPRSYTFEEYLAALHQRGKELEQRSKGKEWRRYNIAIHSDPFAVQLEVIYSMLRHLMWKLTTCQNDVNEMAYAERGFECAMQQAEERMWRLAPDPDEVPGTDEEPDPFSMIEALHRKAGKQHTRVIRQTIDFDRS